MAITFYPLAAGYTELMGRHCGLLDDHVRTAAFQRAIRRAVREGDTVADLGAGTGVLSFFARRALAKHVYAIEVEPILKIARDVADANGIDGITFIEKHSDQVTLPEQVDVLISDCFGVLGIGGDLIKAVGDFRDRHLRPGGAVIPRSLAVQMAPVESRQHHRSVQTWAKRRYDLDWTRALGPATNNLYSAAISEVELLARPAAVVSVDLSHDALGDGFQGHAEFTIERAGQLTGFAGWFETELCEGVELSTAPWSAPTIWRQVYLPLPRALEVERRSLVVLTFAARATHFDWTAEIRGERFEQSTRKSHPG